MNLSVCHASILISANGCHFLVLLLSAYHDSLRIASNGSNGIKISAKLANQGCTGKNDAEIAGHPRAHSLEQDAVALRLHAIGQILADVRELTKASHQTYAMRLHTLN